MRQNVIEKHKICVLCVFGNTELRNMVKECVFIKTHKSVYYQSQNMRFYLNTLIFSVQSLLVFLVFFCTDNEMWSNVCFLLNPHLGCVDEGCILIPFFSRKTLQRFFSQPWQLLRSIKEAGSCKFVPHVRCCHTVVIELHLMQSRSVCLHYVLLLLTLCRWSILEVTEYPSIGVSDTLWRKSRRY